MSGGANTALYVVDDVTTLSAAETAVEGRLTAAGLTVTRIDNTTAAPADVDTYSIVVVAAGDSTGLVGTPGKYALTTAPILWMHTQGTSPGVATFDHYLVSANTAPASTAERQNDILTVHQTTASLALGNYNTCAISSGGTKQYNWPIASMLAAAVVRMDTALSNDPVAWTFESCDALRVGTAPNRRAVLAWFGVMLQFPTTDGQNILDGFIAWCLAGVPCPQGRGLVVGYMTLN